MAYTPTNWTNFPSTATPVNASNLNKIENELVALDTGKADESAVTTALEDKVDKVAGKGLSTNDYDNTAKGIVDGVTTALAGKVDKVEGKGLSTEDFTTAEKTKLAGISAEANKVEITPVVTEGTTLATISIDGVDTDIKGSDIDVDSTLSLVSPNPVQNKVITSTLNEKANSVSIAPLYDSTKTYTYDDYVMYSGRLYKCNAFATTGTFDPTKWVTAELINIVAMRDRIEMSLEEIHEIVQSGLAHEVFNIGDQIVVQWKDNATNVTYDYPLDVVHFEDVTILNDNDEEVTVPAMIVQWHYCSPFGVQFDASEAFYVVPSGGMSAGDYYFNVPTAWGSMTAGNYQFTVDTALSEGTQLTLSVAGGTSTSLVGAKVYAYASSTSTTKIGEYTISSGNSGTNLGQLNNAGDTNINGFQRVIYGYNRWSQSALRQFLNSSETNGNWWTAQNKYDRLPNELATKHGFMSGFSEEFLGIIKPIKINTAKNTVTDDGTIESTFDTFFVPALEQEHINPQIAGEGSVWEYWFRKSQSTTPLAQGGTYPQMRTFAIDNHSSAQTVRLRSASRRYSYYAWGVNSSGSVYGGASSMHSYRFAPACAIC